MTRINYAAKVLADQILTHWPDAGISWPEEADGLGVRRRMVIEDEAYEDIFYALLPIAQHDRRVDHVKAQAHEVVVDFTASRHADDRTPSNLDGVLEVLNAPEPDKTAGSSPSEAQDGQSEPPATKKASKKAATKTDEDA